MSRAFGEHLRRLRKTKSNYTQQDMADLLKISRSTYTYYETGKSEPGQEALGKICDILNIDYNLLLGVEKGSGGLSVASGDVKSELIKLTPEEEQIVMAYRGMRPEDKDFLTRQISGLVRRINAGK